jgi:hypothetical protein
MMDDAMDMPARARRPLRLTRTRLKVVMMTLVAMTMAIAIAVSSASAAAQSAAPQPAAQPAPKPQAAKGVVIRGCLTGSKLSHIDPDDATLKVPDILRVSSLRVIRSQVKALDGHQVEVIGTLHSIPGQDNGLLVAESDKAKLYIGGGDKNLGEDLNTSRSEPPTIYARTIKDIAATCTAGASK